MVATRNILDRRHQRIHNILEALEGFNIRMSKIRTDVERHPTAWMISRLTFSYFVGVQKELGELVLCGVVECRRESDKGKRKMWNHYYLTDKGRLLLQKYRQMDDGWMDDGWMAGDPL